MKILLKVVGGFAALILALVLVAFFFPREYRIERSIVTKAKPEVVMAQVGDLKM
jgi:Na+/serine symporter